MTGQRGFTLIELMIVIAIIAIIAAIAIPNLLSARLSANETAAIATLRSMSSAQAQFQSSSRADADGDGVGAYGTLLELSGAINVREGMPEEVSAMQPPVLSGSFRSVNATGETSRSGYLFKMFLPESDGTGTAPDETGTFADVDEDNAEVTWCCYAWPVNLSNSGNRTFMVNQTGDILSCDDDDYSGPGAGPEAGAAFQPAGPIDSITGLLAIGQAGRDGSTWKQVR